MNATPNFPNTRLRRPRANDWSRRLISESNLTVNDLILPIFVHDGKDCVDIKAMPGVVRHSIESALATIKNAAELGIPAIALFPATQSNLKNSAGSEAINPNNLVCTTLRAAKSLSLNIGLLADVALDPYTDHGHDGVLDSKTGNVENDRTIEILCEQAIVQARAGCDVICPSDMMDGRVASIRKKLDNEGFTNVMIMSYAAKYASAFYGPFRDAIGSSSLTGRDAKLGFRDKSNYQMDFRNSDEALREVALDITEGADYVMVKPGMPFLDIIYRVKTEFKVPTFAYQVSGEYTMLVDAANQGHIDRNRTIIESLTCFKRAGADGILTYFALEAAQILAD